MSQYRTGALLVAASTLVWSSAGVLVRWVAVDPWTTLFWRSIFAMLGLLTYLAVRDRTLLPHGIRRLGRAGIALAVCFGASMICFINALNLTTVAAVLIFQAASPLFAAALAWLLLRERVSKLKFAAILVSIAGVAVMTTGSSGRSGLAGIILSTIMSLTFAGAIVLARVRRDVPTTEATCLATILVAFAALPFTELSLPWRDLLLLAIFGFGQMGLALIMFAAGIRLIPAADAGLISILESILAPIWVWLAFGENPGGNTILGGAIVISAVVAVALYERNRTL